MQPNNKSDEQITIKRSFIEQARRRQIIEATVVVLAEYGYVATTFAKIGKQATISPSLISYHFKDKDELTKETLAYLSAKRDDDALDALKDIRGAENKLMTLIEFDLANMGTHPLYFQAMVEILFGMRNAKGALEYLGDNEDSAVTLLRSILDEGKQSGEFGDIDTKNLAIIIDGARDTFLSQLSIRKDLDLEQFSKTLLTFVHHAVKKD